MATAKTEFLAVRACLFDMDGLLLDSEDIYSLCTNAVLREYGRPDLPWSIKAQLQGRPGPEAGKIFERWAQLPISRAEYIAKLSAYQQQHFPNARPLPGVVHLLAQLTHKDTKSASPRGSTVHLALATSSHSSNFHLKIQNQKDLFDNAFPLDVRVLGDDPRIPPGRGKPAADIYLLALKVINDKISREEGDAAQPITPAECLVFEDSVPGVEAGRRAGMRVVWVPHEGLLKEYKGREKEVLAGLTGEHKEDNVEAEEEGGQDVAEHATESKGRSVGAPGEIDDGWGELLTSLEGFPFARYGITVPGGLSE